MANNKKRYLIFVLQLIAAAVLAAVDQVIKSLIVSHMKGNEDVILIKNVLALSYAENTGAAFSAFSGSTFVLSVITLLMLVGITAYLFFAKIDNKIVNVAAAMVLGGGIGNLIDRFRQGFVVDYIRTLFVNFPVYNFADILVTVGVFILVIYLVYAMVKEEKEKKQGTNEDNKNGAA